MREKIIVEPKHVLTGRRFDGGDVDVSLDKSILVVEEVLIVELFAEDKSDDFREGEEM